MDNIPQKIYLNLGFEPTDEDFKQLTDVTWCADKISEGDIEYTLSAALPVNEWIDVKDGLPVIGTSVLTFPFYKVLPFGNIDTELEGNDIDKSFWEWKGNEDSGYSKLAYPYPTHWQKLPLPPTK